MKKLMMFMFSLLLVTTSVSQAQATVTAGDVVHCKAYAASKGASLRYLPGEDTTCEFKVNCAINQNGSPICERSRFLDAFCSEDRELERSLYAARFRTGDIGRTGTKYSGEKLLGNMAVTTRIKDSDFFSFRETTRYLRVNELEQGAGFFKVPESEYRIVQYPDVAGLVVRCQLLKD